METKQRYIHRMGKELDLIFNKLVNEVVWLFIKWNEYVILFGTDSSRIDLLNKTSPLFFKIVQDTFFEDTILQIARLTDPLTSCGKQNLTIQSLPALVPGEIKEKITKLVKTAKEKAGFCRDWRNRRIAHRDLELIMDQGAESLKSASRVKVKAAIDAIAAVLNVVANHYTDGSIMFDMNQPGGAESLLHIINKSEIGHAEKR